MTVQSDLEQAVAYCEALKGNYALMAHATEENQAKQMFTNMKADLEKHTQFLNARLEYLNQNSELYKKQ